MNNIETALMYTALRSSERFVGVMGSARGASMSWMTLPSLQGCIHGDPESATLTTTKKRTAGKARFTHPPPKFSCPIFNFQLRYENQYDKSQGTEWHEKTFNKMFDCGIGC